MVNYDYTGKTVLITGAASGFGRDAALAFAGAGARLGISDINADALNSVAAGLAETGCEVVARPCDVTVASQVDAFVTATCDALGNLDIAINNAGVGHRHQRLADCDDATFDRVLAVNLKGVFTCMRAELRQMVGHGGVILNIASAAAVTGAPFLGPYAASKHGVVGLTRSAALEYARKGIRINALCPSFAATPLLDDLVAEKGDAGLDALAGANPMQRLGQPQEIVEAMLWLCSDANSFMTGQAIAVDGGLTA